jgi:hypothetical protein
VVAALLPNHRDDGCKRLGSLQMVKRIALKTIEIAASCFIIAIAMSTIECGLMFREARRREARGE